MYIYSTSEGANEDVSIHLLNVSDTYTETGGRVTLTRRAESSLVAVFANGVGVMVNVTAGIPNFVLSLPPSFKGQTRGLLGNFNGNKTDEFLPRNEAGGALSDAISDQEIHVLFGQTC